MMYAIKSQMKNVKVDVLYETELIGVIAILSGSKYLEERNNAQYRNDIFLYFKKFLKHKRFWIIKTWKKIVCLTMISR